MKRVIVSLLFMYAISCDAIIEVKTILAYELGGGDGLGTPTLISLFTYVEYFPSTQTSIVDDALLLPDPANLALVDKVYLKQLLDYTKMFFKDFEDRLNYIINLGSTEYIPPNYADTLLLLLGIKDETKILMSVIKVYRKLASKLAKVVSK